MNCLCLSVFVCTRLSVCVCVCVCVCAVISQKKNTKYKIQKSQVASGDAWASEVARTLWKNEGGGNSFIDVGIAFFFVSFVLFVGIVLVSLSLSLSLSLSDSLPPSLLPSLPALSRSSSLCTPYVYQYIYTYTDKCDC